MGQDQSSAADGNPKSMRREFLTDPRDRTQLRQKAKLDDIVVVSSKIDDKQEKCLDEDIQRLKNIKFNKSVLSNNVAGHELDYVHIPRITSGPVTEMILRYQLHLTECAEAVSFDQTVLTKQIKEVDSVASYVYKNMNDRHKVVEHFISQIDIAELFGMLEKIEANLINTKLQFKMLNRLLSDEDQIYDPEFT